MRWMPVVVLLGLSTAAGLMPALAVRAADKEAATPELKADELYKSASPSVMTLTVHRKDAATVQGTAFLAIKDGIAVTAWHVVNNAEKVTAKFVNGEEFEVSGLIDRDVRRDVALIRVKVFGRPLLPTAADDPAVGGKAYVIGAPRGLEFSITDGLVSQIRQEEGHKVIQFTCPSSPGNSGGPVFDGRGRVLGVISFQRTDGQNLNFAAPITYALGLDSSLPTQPWETVKAEATVLPTLTPKPGGPLPLPDFKAPAARHNTLKLKVPKKEPYTLLVPTYQKHDLKTVQVVAGKDMLQRVTGEPQGKKEYALSDVGVLGFSRDMRGKEVEVTSEYIPHRVAIYVLGDPSKGDLQEALKKVLESWGDETVAGAEVKAEVEKAHAEGGGFRGLGKLLNCDRLVVGSTDTNSVFIPAGLASGYSMATRVTLAIYDLASGEKLFDRWATRSGSCAALGGVRNFRGNLVKGCTGDLINPLAGGTE